MSASWRRDENTGGGFASSSLSRRRRRGEPQQRWRPGDLEGPDPDDPRWHEWVRNSRTAAAAAAVAEDRRRQRRRPAATHGVENDNANEEPRAWEEEDLSFSDEEELGARRDQQRRSSVARRRRRRRGGGEQGRRQRRRVGAAASVAAASSAGAPEAHDDAASPQQQREHQRRAPALPALALAPEDPTAVPEAMRAHLAWLDDQLMRAQRREMRRAQQRRVRHQLAEEAGLPADEEAERNEAREADDEEWRRGTEALLAHAEEVMPILGRVEDDVLHFQQATARFRQRQRMRRLRDLRLDGIRRSLRATPPWNLSTPEPEPLTATTPPQAAAVLASALPRRLSRSVSFAVTEEESHDDPHQNRQTNGDVDLLRPPPPPTRLVGILGDVPAAAASSAAEELRLDRQRPPLIDVLPSPTLMQSPEEHEDPSAAEEGLETTTFGDLLGMLALRHFLRGREAEDLIMMGQPQPHGRNHDGGEGEEDEEEDEEDEEDDGEPAARRNGGRFARTEEELEAAEARWALLIAELLGPVRRNLSEEQLNRLPTRVVPPAPPAAQYDDEEEDGTESPEAPCAICHCAMEPGETVRTLRCDHEFHSLCIDRWLLHESPECPLCRRDQRPPTSSPESDERGTSTRSSSLSSREDPIHRRDRMPLADEQEDDEDLAMDTDGWPLPPVFHVRLSPTASSTTSASSSPDNLGDGNTNHRSLPVSPPAPWNVMFWNEEAPSPSLFAFRPERHLGLASATASSLSERSTTNDDNNEPPRRQSPPEQPAQDGDGAAESSDLEEV